MQYVGEATNDLAELWTIIRRLQIGIQENIQELHIEIDLTMVFYILRRKEGSKLKKVTPNNFSQYG